MLIITTILILLIIIFWAFQKLQALPVIPILKYHHVNGTKPDVITISPEVFERHIISLKNMGYKSIFLSELEGRLYRKNNLSGKTIAITFDDGFFDNYKFVFPILKKHDFKATLFLSTYFIKEASENPSQKVIKDDFKSALLNNDFSGFLNWEQVKEMYSSGLIDFGPHTHFHRYRFMKSSPIASINNVEELDFKTLSCFDETPKKGQSIFKSGASLITRAFDPKSGHVETKHEYVKRIMQEIAASRSLIEQKLAKKCSYLAWPWGLFNRSALKIARQLGFRLCLTTFYGSNHLFTSRFKIKRFTPTVDMDYFPLEILRNSYLLSSLCIDNKLYNLFSKRFIKNKLKEITKNG